MGLTLELAHIYKAYGGQQVVTDCSFTFEPGGTYVIMGPNGCGKSTLLRIAALLEKPDQGEVKFLNGGNPIEPDINLKRRLTMVFPRVGVFNTTVAKNVAYGLQIRGVAKSEMQARVDSALELVRLTHKRTQRALTLSSGETMRLGLARGLAIEPDILFLDEPTTSIDVANTKIIEQVLRRISQDKKLTLIIVTHDAAQAARFSGRLLFMRDGNLVDHL
ncbi:MAG: ATP-binding cassette domain-containing protein [Deltaproteobacteria bacterium]|nr:ATP-binding cassette domain-containing protein [Deltaproteobacteria bacterium]